MIDRLKNQQITAGQLRALLRLESILVVLVLGLAYFAYQQYQQAQEATENREIQQQRLAAVRDDLVFFESSNDKQKLEEEMAQLRSIPLPLGLPNYQQALEVGRTITTFAQEHDLPLTGFDQVEVRLPLGEDTEFPALRYTIIVKGDEDGLTDLLQLLKQNPTAKVTTLEFTRPPPDAEGNRQPDWEMKLDMDVIYR